MVKTLKDKYTCIKPFIIKAINSTWIINKIQPVISVDPNISRKALNTILEESMVSNHIQYFERLGQRQISS
jgi:hypothetical protein